MTWCFRGGTVLPWLSRIQWPSHSLAGQCNPNAVDFSSDVSVYVTALDSDRRMPTILSVEKFRLRKMFQDQSG